MWFEALGRRAAIMLGRRFRSRHSQKPSAAIEQVKSPEVVQLVGMVGCSGRGELGCLLLRLFFAFSIEDRLEGVSAE